MRTSGVTAQEHETSESPKAHWIRTQRIRRSNYPGTYDVESQPVKLFRGSIVFDRIHSLIKGSIHFRSFDRTCKKHSYHKGGRNTAYTSHILEDGNTDNTDNGPCVVSMLPLTSGGMGRCVACGVRRCCVADKRRDRSNIAEG